MSIHYTLLGGPPWGMRITHDHELRPILPGGRACVEGLRAGDQIESVNNEIVTSCGQAHALIQAAQGQLRLRILRNSDPSPSMSATDVVCNSTLNSPLLEQKTLNSVEEEAELKTILEDRVSSHVG
uniref:PDZ domain-containing protein n=1 Tax=Heterorhabditis bacteriophora TaxID=37862 RepID=A0A1I7WMN2_HETBA